MINLTRQQHHAGRKLPGPSCGSPRCIAGGLHQGKTHIDDAAESTCFVASHSKVNPAKEDGNWNRVQARSAACLCTGRACTTPANGFNTLSAASHCAVQVGILLQLHGIELRPWAAPTGQRGRNLDRKLGARLSPAVLDQSVHRDVCED